MAQRIRLYFRRALGSLLLLAAAVWTADWLILHLKIASDRNAFGSVEVHHRYAFPEEQAD